MPFNVLILHQGELDIAKWYWKSYFCGTGSFDCLWQSGLKILRVFLHCCTVCIFFMSHKQRPVNVQNYWVGDGTIFNSPK